MSLSGAEMIDGDVPVRKGCHCCHLDVKELKKEFGYCRNPTEKRLFGEWVDETTVHGVVHVFKGASKLRRVLWFLIVVCSFGGLLYSFIDRLLFLLSGPSKTSVRFDAALPEGVAFPAVTLCNLEQISQSYADQENLTSFLNYLSDIYPENQDFSECSNELDGTRNVADVSKTLRELYVEGVPQATVFLAYCSFGGVAFNCDQHFVPIMTQVGLCYTFNGNLSRSARTVNSTGQHHALRVIMNISSGVLLPNSVGDQGVKVVVHPRGVPPEPDESGIAVPPGRNSFVSLRARSFSDMSSNSTCGSVDLPFFSGSEYSLPACRQNHLLSAVREECSCLDPITGGYRNISADFADTPECTVADACCVVERYFMSNLDLCPSSCRFDSYEATVSYSKYPSTLAASEIAPFLFTDAAAVEGDLVSLNVYFGELHIQVTEVSNAYDVVALLSDLGGQMGLFLGVSIISVIEIIMFLMDEIRACIFPKYWKKIKEDRDKSEGGKPALSAKNSEAIEMRDNIKVDEL